MLLWTVEMEGPFWVIYGALERVLSRYAWYKLLHFEGPEFEDWPTRYMEGWLTALAE